MDTLIRTKNVKLFLELETAPTLKKAAENSGLTIQHALRLIKSWVSSSYIKKIDRRYAYTEQGYELKRKLLAAQ
jgi:predicted transcriptional regulator